MHRIDSAGATVDKKFTVGNSALSIPATIVSAEIANAWQEEIVNVVLESGQTLLDSGNDTFKQLSQAISTLIANGGALTSVVQVLANNSVDQDVLDSGNAIIFDGAAIKNASYNINIVRNTDSSELIEVGKVTMAFEPKKGDWFIETSTSFDDSGVNFNLVATTGAEAKLTYSTNNLSGTSYFGEVTLSNYQETRV